MFHLLGRFAGAVVQCTAHRGWKWWRRRPNSCGIQGFAPLHESIWRRLFDVAASTMISCCTANAWQLQRLQASGCLCKRVLSPVGANRGASLILVDRWSDLFQHRLTNSTSHPASLHPPRTRSAALYREANERTNAVPSTAVKSEELVRVIDFAPRLPAPRTRSESFHTPSADSSPLPSQRRQLPHS